METITLTLTCKEAADADDECAQEIAKLDDVISAVCDPGPETCTLTVTIPYDMDIARRVSAVVAKMHPGCPVSWGMPTLVRPSDQ